MHLSFRSSALHLVVVVAVTAVAAACGSSSPTAPAPAVNASSAVQAGAGVSNASTRTTAFSAASSGVTPILDTRTNPTCSDLANLYGSGATWFELKLDRLPNVTDGEADSAMSITITNGGPNSFNWSATRGVDAVLVKAGKGPHNVYLYSPEAAADTDLVTTDKFEISHITFCYDVELLVSKTAATTFTRDFDWSITKTVNNQVVTVPDGGSATANYIVGVTKDSGTDSAWAVSGNITVTNPHPTLTASGISVSDEMTDFGAVSVNCPSTLAPLASMTCPYATPVGSGASRTNTASATITTYGFAAGTGSTPVAFVTPTTVLDNAVTVTDTFAGAGLPTSPISATQTFSYARTLVAANFAQCGVATTFGNTATIATDDNISRLASASVTATLSCPPPPPPPPPVSTGCTLTQGYWGTHSSKGPAKYDATWALIGENTLFYQSGTTYYGVMQLPTKGNAYYILAHQFIAAKLNIAKGAAAPTGFNMAAVEAFFQTNTPAQIGAMKGSAPLRAQAISWAATLAAYNEGRLNVSHCS